MPDPTNLEGLPHAADLAMYSAELAGKGRWAAFDPAVHGDRRRAPADSPPASHQPDGGRDMVDRAG